MSMRKDYGMSISLNNNKLFRLLRQRGRWQTAALAVLVLAGSVVALSIWMKGSPASANGPVFAVQRGPLTISLSESGTVQNRDQVVLKCGVEGSTTVLWLIPEGTNVKEGDLLMELDSAKLMDDKTRQEITVMNADASFVQARENLEVTKSQTETDIAQAELKFSFATSDLKKYIEGEYPQQVQQANADITIADEELNRANDKLNWSRTLAKEGFITKTELQADELAADKAKIDLDLAKSKLTLLKEWTYQRTLDQLTSDKEQAEKALERVRRKATADVVQAQANKNAREAELTRQTAILDKINQQIAKCHITAPVPGMVVYATTGKANFRGNIEPLEEGRQVRERQELIYLPTTSSMRAEIKVHESSLRKVRSGMPVRITVDALPGRRFHGTVGKIGLLPDAQSAFMNPDLKVYTTEINMDDVAEDLRAGMTCRAEIIVEEYADAIFVPVQSVVRVGGQYMAYVAGGGAPEARPVRVGLDNNRMIRVLEGLDVGEQVLLAPPLAPSSVVTEAAQAAEDQAIRQEAAAVPSPGMSGAGNGRPTTAPAASPASRPSEDAGAPGDRPASRPRMTPEERQQYLDSLTPEQRAELQKRRAARGAAGGQGGDAGPGAPGGTGAAGGGQGGPAGQGGTGGGQGGTRSPQGGGAQAPR
jgi:HlyD family secretion protein